MFRYAPKEIVCSNCSKTVPYVLTDKKVCRACLTQQAETEIVLSELEAQILQKESDIVDLQTIINITLDLQNKIHNRLQRVESR